MHDQIYHTAIRALLDLITPAVFDHPTILMILRIHTLCQIVKIYSKEVSLFIMMYADDMVLLYESPEGLQTMLDIVMTGNYQLMCVKQK